MNKINAIKTLLNELTTDEALEVMEHLREKTTDGEVLTCSGGDYYLDMCGEAYGIFGVSEGARLVGIGYQTKAEAERAGKMRTHREILNNIIRQLNEKDGFKADWSEGTKCKYFPVYDSAHNRWVRDACVTYKTIGQEHCSKESVIYLVDKLNDGLVEGIPRHLEGDE